MNSALKKGQYKIKMEFRAWLTDDLAGLYKSTYKRKDGTEVYVTIPVFCRFVMCSFLEAGRQTMAFAFLKSKRDMLVR